ncbi:MAG: glycosyltransferase [Candidatus Alcyoniella australis]|nr:glycosyltransferase [Candidatus Alcyoniella australis]
MTAVKNSAIICAHNEEMTIAGVINAVRNDVEEVIVIDSCSTDDTGRIAGKCGACVFPVNRLGKHYAIRAGVNVARGENLIFIDGDLQCPPTNIAARLLMKLKPDVSLVKGYYKREPNLPDTGPGRLTEICARPLLTLFMPSLSKIRDPLSGEFALRYELARKIHFTPGFSVDLGILIECTRYGRIEEVELGVKCHKHRHVYDIGASALEVAATILGLTNPEKSAKLTQYPHGNRIVKEIDLSILPPLNGSENDGFNFTSGL